MSKRVTVNLPDDVAERLEQETNVSAFVTEAIRQRVQRERGLTQLAAHFGPEVLSDAARQRARARIAAADAASSSEGRQRLRERFGVQRRAS